MGKRTDIESILIIGAGPIVIGQACEFDYSGAQACRALHSLAFETYVVALYFSHPREGCLSRHHARYQSRFRNRQAVPRNCRRRDYFCLPFRWQSS